MNSKIKNKNIILRADLNVPLTNSIDGIKISDKKRINAMLPTLNWLINNDPNRIIIISHLSRPDGTYDAKLSLEPIYLYLKNMSYDIKFIPYKPRFQDFFNINGTNKIYLLDNIRFYKEELNCDKFFCECLSALGDVFVNDAFGTMHRKHSSMVGINVQIKFYGLLVRKELEMFNLILKNKDNKKICAVIGGSKVSDKIKLLENLSYKIDYLIIGGGMAFTFKKVLENYEIGNSLFDENGSKLVNKIINMCKKNNVKVVLPIDFVVNNNFSDVGKIHVTRNIKSGYMGLDIGPESVKLFNETINKSDIVVWNGPMGVFEMDVFSKGSIGLLDNICSQNIISIIGGGDTAHLVEKYNYQKKVTFVSTGGGASLKLLEQGHL